MLPAIWSGVTVHQGSALLIQFWAWPKLDSIQNIQTARAVSGLAGSPTDPCSSRTRCSAIFSTPMKNPPSFAAPETGGLFLVFARNASGTPQAVTSENG